MFTTERHPGRYESNRSALMAEVVHRVTLVGCERECGDVDRAGFWMGLILGKRYAWTVREDSQGFIDVTPYGSHAEAISFFDALEKAVA